LLAGCPLKLTTDMSPIRALKDVLRELPPKQRAFTHDRHEPDKGTETRLIRVCAGRQGRALTTDMSPIRALKHVMVAAAAVVAADAHDRHEPDKGTETSGHNPVAVGRNPVNSRQT